MILKLLLSSQMTGDINKSIEEYNPNKKRSILIIFDDMIADVLSNKNLIQQLLHYLSEVEF